MKLTPSQQFCRLPVGFAAFGEDEVLDAKEVTLYQQEVGFIPITAVSQFSDCLCVFFLIGMVVPP